MIKQKKGEKNENININYNLILLFLIKLLTLIEKICGQT